MKKNEIKKLGYYKRIFSTQFPDKTGENQKFLLEMGKGFCFVDRQMHICTETSDFYMDKLADMMDSDNSYIRTRGLTLIAYNAKWDKYNKIAAYNSLAEIEKLQIY